MTTYEPPNFLFTDTPTTPDPLAETNLTLLCLDYLRDLRRSYAPRELWEAEGMDADYLSLAVWALGRVFVRPGRLRWEAAKVMKRGDEKVLGGGGMGEEGCISVGNDCYFTNAEDGDEFGEPNIREEDNGYHLTGNITIPSMEEMVQEILLLPKQSSNMHQKSMYEYNDGHASNAHRYYLLNGLASGGGGEDKLTALPSLPGNNNNLRSPRSAMSLALNGGPLTIGEIVHAGITTLQARTRIEAEREMVFQNPLFQQFVMAVGSKGFFEKKEKKKSDAAAGATSGGNSIDHAFQNPEEEQRRARIVYEEKYRKVVTKFRTKLAAKAEASSQQRPILSNSTPQHYPISTTQQFPSYGYPPPNNVHHPPPLMTPNSISSVANHQRQKREMRIHQVHAGGRDGYALNQERGRLMTERQQYSMQQQQTQQPQAPSQYQPLHQVQQPQASPQSERPPTQQSRPPTLQSKPPPVKTEQKPTGQWDTPKSQKHWPDSTKSTLSTKFNFDSHVSPFDKATPTNSKPPTSPKSNRRSKPPTISVKTTTTISQPQYTPRLHEPEPDPNESNQHEAENLNAEGNQLMQKKQFAEALQSYSAALRFCSDGPNSHVYYSNRSAAYLSLNDHASSIRDSESSLQLCPDYAKAHSRLGLAYFVSGQYQEAVRAYEVALKYEPDNEWNRSHYDKALKKMNKGQRKSVQERPFDEETVHSPNSKNNDDEEEAAASEVSKTREADEYKDAGNTHMSKKEYEEALKQYTQAISISPAGSNSHVYYSNRAAAYCYLGQYDIAVDDCMTSIEINPEYEKAYARLGLSRFFLDDFEGAIEAYERALELDPTNAASKSYLNKARMRLEEQTEAEKEKSDKFIEQQKELQRAMEQQLIMQDMGSEGDGDSWT